ncbi:Uncharacterized protein Fot_02282 [Forsythia ovata]|uniref:Uncharacterized protein n=1 Tax=Forsythia ovata TaxID=205694 RepID=A0ABD1X9C9_9LAMI
MKGLSLDSKPFNDVGLYRNAKSSFKNRALMKDYQELQKCCIRFLVEDAVDAPLLEPPQNEGIMSLEDSSENVKMDIVEKSEEEVDSLGCCSCFGFNLFKGIISIFELNDEYILPCEEFEEVLFSEFKRPVKQAEKPKPEFKRPVKQAEKPKSEFKRPVKQVEEPRLEFKIPVKQVEEPRLEFNIPVKEVEEPRLEFKIPSIVVDFPKPKGS